MKYVFCLFVSFFLMISNPCKAEEDPFALMEPMESKSVVKSPIQGLFLGGYVESWNHLGVKDESSWQKNDLLLRLNLNYQQNSLIRGFFSIDLLEDITPDTEINQGYEEEETDVEIHEAYLTIDTNRFDLRIGKQIIRWGTGDEINPTDLINPEDIDEYFVLDKEDRKIGILMVDTLFYSDIASLELVFIPRYKSAKLPPGYSIWQDTGQKEFIASLDKGEIVIDDAKKPDAKFKNSEAGGRIFGTCLGADFSLSYLYVHTDFPVYKKNYIDMSTGTSIVHMSPFYYRYHMFGTAFARIVEYGTIRFECAYLKGKQYALDMGSTEFIKDRDGISKYDEWQAVLGIDYLFGENLYINMQYYRTEILNYDQSIAKEKIDDGFTIEINKLFFDDDLKIDIEAFYHLPGKSVMIHPYVEYKIIEGLLLNLGYYAFLGKKDTLLGQFRDNDLIVIRLKYSF